MCDVFTSSLIKGVAVPYLVCIVYLSSSLLLVTSRMKVLFPYWEFRFTDLEKWSESSTLSSSAYLGTLMSLHTAPAESTPGIVRSSHIVHPMALPCT